MIGVKVGFHFSRRMMSTSCLSGKIGFIGLGNMGANMANNLQKNGCDLVLYDLNPDAPGIKPLTSNGATFTRSIPEFANHDLSCVISMVTAPQHVRTLYLGPDGLLSTLRSRPLIVDCSTIDPETTIDVAGQASSAGFRMVDAPVGGGVPAAQNGTLTFMVGGADEDFKDVEPLLKKMGKNIYHCGGVSLGQAAKVCNNLILAASMLGTAEGFRLGVEFGLDPKVLYGIVNNSSGRCWSSEIYCPAPHVVENSPACRDYEAPSFMVDLMAKDVKLAVSAAHSLGTTAPISEFSAKMFDAISEAGYGRKDIGCAFKYIPKVLK